MWASVDMSIRSTLHWSPVSNGSLRIMQTEVAFSSSKIIVHIEVENASVQALSDAGFPNNPRNTFLLAKKPASLFSMKGQHRVRGARHKSYLTAPKKPSLLELGVEEQHKGGKNKRSALDPSAFANWTSAEFLLFSSVISVGILHGNFGSKPLIISKFSFPIYSLSHLLFFLHGPTPIFASKILRKEQQIGLP